MLKVVQDEYISRREKPSSYFRSNIFDMYKKRKTYHDGYSRLLPFRIAFPLPNPPPNKLCRFKPNSTMRSKHGEEHFPNGPTGIGGLAR